MRVLLALLLALSAAAKEREGVVAPPAIEVEGKTLQLEGSGAEVDLPGKDFADALFSVWLGKHPVDDELKREMLLNR